MVIKLMLSMFKM